MTLPFLAQSCKFWTEEPQPKEQPLAKVHDKYLYPSDLEGMVPRNTPPEDSLQIIKEYTRDWIKNQLILRLARKNLPPEQLDFNRQVQDYKNSLIQYTYKQALIRQKMDTTIHPDTIQKYYDHNKESYILKRPIAQLLYIRVPKETPKLDSARYWIQHQNDTSIRHLKNYCYQYGGSFRLKPRQWIHFDELYTHLPTDQPPEQFLKNQTSYAIFRGEQDLHLINILKYRLKGEVTPLPFVKDEIRKIIMNRQKSQFLDKMYKNIYQEALKKGTFKTYF